jgi:arginyl-tRNA synthetase
MESTESVMINISKYLTSIFTKAALETFKDYLPENFEGQVVWNSLGTSDLTSPIAMKIYNLCNKKENWKYSSSKEVGEELIKNIKDEKSIIEETKIEQEIDKKKNKKEKKKKQVPETTYIDINIKNSYIENISLSILKKGIKITTEYTKKKVLCDFSSPNIAKEMHIGHLRSTIIGDSICRVLEFLDNDVMRINHVGDWGTQFGMLIAYLESINPKYETSNENIRDLEEFYKHAKEKFDSDNDFKKLAQLKTVELQKGNENTRKAWEFICQVSRENFEKIYKRLDINLKEVGESFYDPLSRKIIPILEEKNLLEKDQGAVIMRLEGEKQPLIIVKSDGGIGYDTTDLVALEYRINECKRDWIIYVVGSEQKDHFRLLFKAGKKCGWMNDNIRVDHMDFGLVQGKDGKKFSTRKGGIVKLADVLDEAWEDAKKEMIKRNEKNNSGMSLDYINEASEKLGYSAIKYFDLKQFRVSNYRFDQEKMLDDKGNTAVYLFYTYVRICSIYRKNNISEKDIQSLIENEKIVITHKDEKKLLVQLLKFNDVIDDVLKDLALNLLCDYVYGIATNFAVFYENCKVIGNNSRILIIELCKRFMKLTFDLLGLTPIEKI